MAWPSEGLNEVPEWEHIRTNEQGMANTILCWLARNAAYIHGTVMDQEGGPNGGTTRVQKGYKGWYLSRVRVSAHCI